jgi:hypothetical protein
LVLQSSLNWLWLNITAILNSLTPTTTELVKIIENIWIINCWEYYFLVEVILFILKVLQMHVYITFALTINHILTQNNLKSWLDWQRSNFNKKFNKNIMQKGLMQIEFKNTLLTTLKILDIIPIKEDLNKCQRFYQFMLIVWVF